MRNPWTLRLLVGAFVASAGLFWLQPSWGQEEALIGEDLQLEIDGEMQQLEIAKHAMAQAKQRAEADARRTIKIRQRMDPRSELRQAAEALRDAEGEEARSEAKGKFLELLSQHFDEDMERREEELEKIRERLQKLTEQLERRRDKKDEIVDLQAQVLLNEADGLGFFSNSDSSAFTFAREPFGDNPFQIHVNPQLQWEPKPPIPVTPGTPFGPVPAAEPAPSRKAKPRKADSET